MSDSALKTDAPRANVLVLGKSGSGKSTLINAVLGTYADTSWGSTGTTKETTLYEGDEDAPFHLIDTVGFEPSFLKMNKAIHSLKQWTKDSLKKSPDNKVSVIWFCVDGMSTKLFNEEMKNFTKASHFWKDIPIIIVVTKSITTNKEDNIRMIQTAINQHPQLKETVKAIIPVVAKQYKIVSGLTIEPFGIDELVKKTCSLIPSGERLADQTVNRFLLKRKRIYSQVIVSASTLSGITIGFSPIPFADAYLLAPMETAEVKGIALVYGIKDNSQSERFFDTIIEAGTLSITARGLISALKAIPGLNIGADALNGLIAGLIVALVGEASVSAFEQVYLGEKSLDDLQWVKKLVENKLAISITQTLSDDLKKINGSLDKNTITQIIKDLLKKLQ